MPSAVIYTLGCRLNTADSALLTDRLQRAGYEIVDANSAGIAPELVVINSCTVTAEAARKSRQLARKLRQRFPLARLVATGCSAELDREIWETEQTVDAVLSNPAKRKIAEFTGPAANGPAGAESSLAAGNAVFREDAASLFPFRSRAFIKIQEGCENFCTYCIVPYVRGPERSRELNEVLQDCRQALAAGRPELVLTGVNAAAYADSGCDLAGLLRQICRLPGDFRVRLSSTEPHPANRQLLKVMAAEPKVCRFLHLSLQHGSDRILKLMNRKYTSVEFAEFAAEARKMIPGLSLGTDLIVGFPGETEEDFEAGRQFVRAMHFANTHLFSYSPRPGTPAAGFPGRVPPAEIKRRYELLRQEAVISRTAFRDAQLGSRAGVIFEEKTAAGECAGWTDHYLQVRQPAAECQLDRIVPVTLTAVNCLA